MVEFAKVEFANYDNYNFWGHLYPLPLLLSLHVSVEVIISFSISQWFSQAQINFLNLLHTILITYDTNHRLKIIYAPPPP